MPKDTSFWRTKRRPDCTEEIFEPWVCPDVVIEVEGKKPTPNLLWSIGIVEECGAGSPGTRHDERELGT